MSRQRGSSRQIARSAGSLVRSSCRCTQPCSTIGSTPLRAPRPTQREQREMAERVAAGRPTGSLRRVLLPLALAQFICSFAGSNMNVMINDISEDLDTTVQGVQTAITLFLLVMAALMIPGGKLTDRWGRMRCFTIGLVVYGVGALLSALSPGLGLLILGNSIL